MKLFTLLCLASGCVALAQARPTSLVPIPIEPIGTSTNCLITEGSKSRNPLSYAPGSRNSESKEEKTELILEEDFSLITTGAEDNFDTSKDLTGYVIDYENGKIDPNASYTISSELTHTPGWTGFCVYGAGGAVALHYPDLGGVLNTPNNLNLFGVIRVSFRTKTATEYPCTILVTPAHGDFVKYDVQNATEHRTFARTIRPEEGWVNVSFEIDVPYQGNDAFIQFNAATYSDGVLIDDIKIEKLTDRLLSPFSIAPSLFTPEGFTLSWKGDPKTEEYILNLWEGDFDPNPTIDANIDFEDIAIDGDLVTDFKAPEGWKFELNPAYPQWGTNPDNQTKGIIFREDQEKYSASKWLPSIYTPAEGLVEDFKCDIVLLTANTIDDDWEEKPLNPEWRLFGIDENGTQKRIATGSIENKAGTKVAFDIKALKTRYGEENFSGQYKGFVLSLVPYNDASILVDNISFTAKGPDTNNNVVKDLHLTETSYTFTGLDMKAEHYFSLQSVAGTQASEIAGPGHIFGVQAPKALEATNIDNEKGSFTANWEKVERATGYNIELLRRFNAEKDVQDFPILAEDFSKLDDMPYTVDDPYEIGGGAFPLDDFTKIPGWIVTGGQIAAGMVGCLKDDSQILFVRTPYLDLTNGSGKVKVTVKATAGTPADRLRVQSVDEIKDLTFDDKGNINGSVILDKPLLGYLYLYTASGDDFFIDQVEISQDLKKGDKVECLVETLETENSDETDCTFRDLAKEEGMEYVYRIYSWAYDRDTGEEYLSEASNEISVVLLPTAINEVETGDMQITLNGLSLTAPMPSDIYNLQGMLLAEKTCNFTAEEAGVYIIRNANGSAKVFLK